jgi:hypothetical protein
MRAYLADLGGSVRREKKDRGGQTEHRKEGIPKLSEPNESSGSAARRDPLPGTHAWGEQDRKAGSTRPRKQRWGWKERRRERL